MKLTLRQLLRFLVAAAIVATLTILIIRGRDPSFLNFHGPSVGEAALDRVIDDVQIDSLPLNEAVEVLSRKANVPITFEDGALRKSNHRLIVLRATHLSLDQALIQLCRQAGDAIDYRPTSEGIVVSTVVSCLHHMVVDVYDFWDVSSRGPRPDDKLWARSPRHAHAWIIREQSGLAGAAVVRWGLGEGWNGRWAYLQPGPARISPFNERLIFPSTPSMHRQMSQFIRYLTDVEASPMPDRSAPLGIKRLEHGQWLAETGSPAENALRRTITAFRVKSRPFGQLTAELAQKGQVNISVNWAAIQEGAGIARQSPVNLDVRAGGATLADLLNVICGPFLGEGRIDFRPDGGAIDVGLRSNVLTTRMYDLRLYFSRFDQQHYRLAANQLIVGCLSSVDQARSQERWPDDDYQFVGPELIVTTTWSQQSAIAALLKKFIESSATQPVR